jgi:WD40 repeat protein
VTSDGTSGSIWSVNNGRIDNVPFEGNSENLVSIQSVSISPDGLLVATASNRAVMIWQVENGKLVHGPLVGHAHDIHALNFSADGKMVVSGSEDRNVWVWSAETGGSIRGPMKSHTASVEGVCFRCTLTCSESWRESDVMYQSRREAGCQRYVLIA